MPLLAVPLGFPLVAGAMLLDRICAISPDSCVGCALSDSERNHSWQTDYTSAHSWNDAFRKKTDFTDIVSDPIWQYDNDICVLSLGDSLSFGRVLQKLDGSC